MPTQEDLMAQAQAVQAKYTDILMKKANVQGTAVGLAKSGGQYSDKVALVVLVSKKMPVSQLRPEDIIPKELDGIPVDVQEVGVITAQ